MGTKYVLFVQLFPICSSFQSVSLLNSLKKVAPGVTTLMENEAATGTPTFCLDRSDRQLTIAPTDHLVLVGPLASA